MTNSQKNNFEPTDHRQFIELKLAEIEARINAEGVTIDVEKQDGSFSMKKHPLIDAYTQLVAALAKIDPTSVYKEKQLNLNSFLGTKDGK